MLGLHDSGYAASLVPALDILEMALLFVGLGLILQASLAGRRLIKGQGCQNFYQDEIHN